MKFAVSVEEAKADSLVDPRFGRSPYFALVNDEGMEFVENAAVSSGHGAGIQAAQSIVELGVSAVVSGHVGPNAWRVLQAAGIDVYQAEALSLAEVIAKMHAGELSQVHGATGPGHAGMRLGR